MSCVRTVERQTEFEFLQQLLKYPYPHLCCGPVCSIVFDRKSMARILASVSSSYLDSFDAEVLDSQNMKMSMCARHWMQLSSIVQPDSDDVSFYIFTVVCLLSAWDTKELSNYLF